MELGIIEYEGQVKVTEREMNIWIVICNPEMGSFTYSPKVTLNMPQVTCLIKNFIIAFSSLAPNSHYSIVYMSHVITACESKPCQFSVSLLIKLIHDLDVLIS